MPGSLCTRNDAPERRHCAATRRARHARAGAAWRVGLSGSVRPCHAWTAAPGEDDAAARYRFSRRAPPLWCPATPQGRPPAGAGGTYRWTDPVTDRPGYGPGCSGADGKLFFAVGMGGRTRRPGVLMHAGCDSRGMGRAATEQPPLGVSGQIALGLTSGDAVALRRASSLPIRAACDDPTAAS